MILISETTIIPPGYVDHIEFINQIKNGLGLFIQTLRLDNPEFVGQDQFWLDINHNLAIIFFRYQPTEQITCQIYSNHDWSAIHTASKTRIEWIEYIKSNLELFFGNSPSKHFE